MLNYLVKEIFNNDCNLTIAQQNDEVDLILNQYKILEDVLQKILEKAEITNNVLYIYPYPESILNQLYAKLEMINDSYLIIEKNNQLKTQLSLCQDSLVECKEGYPEL